MFDAPYMALSTSDVENPRHALAELDRVLRLSRSVCVARDRQPNRPVCIRGAIANQAYFRNLAAPV
jgi:hypothetical protein